MADKVGGSGPPPAGLPLPEANAPKKPRPSGKVDSPVAPPAAAVTASGDAYAGVGGSPPSLANTAPMGLQLENRLQNLARQIHKPLKFADADTEMLARTFIALSLDSDYAKAGRKERAQRFINAILAQKRLKALFGGLSAPEMERMCDEIAQVLADAPKFGQWIDDVAEGVHHHRG